MRTTFEELKRRRNFQVAAVYVVVAWVSMQVIAVMTPALHLPDWVDSFFAIAFIAGFPIAMILAWAYDLTSDGVVRTDDEDAATGETRTRHAPIRIFAVSAIGIASMIALWYSPLGLAFLKSPETRNVDTGLEYVENYTRKDAIPEAQKIFKAILAKDPDHAAARAGLAMALMREYTHLERDPALLQQAKANAQASLRSDEHLALANIAVACMEVLSGNFENANKLLDRAEILEPENPFSLECRAAIFRSNVNLVEAIRTLEHGIELHPDYTPFYTALGLNYSDVGQYEKAEEVLKVAANLAKENPRVYAQLSYVLHQQNKTQEAINVIQDGLKVGETALLYNNLGIYLFFQGQFELAAEAFEKTLELKGDTHDYLYWANIGDAYRQVPSKIEKANAAYRRALQLLQVELDKQPTHPNLNSRAALYNAKLGDFEMAQTAFTNVLSQEEMSPIMLYRALVMFEIMGDREQALTMLNRALDAGYPIVEIKNDPELALLRQDQGYHTLLSTKEREP